MDKKKRESKGEVPVKTAQKKKESGAKGAGAASKGSFFSQDQNKYKKKK